MILESPSHQYLRSIFDKICRNEEAVYYEGCVM